MTQWIQIVCLAGNFFIRTAHVTLYSSGSWRTRLTHQPFLSWSWSGCVRILRCGSPGPGLRTCGVLTTVHHQTFNLMRNMISVDHEFEFLTMPQPSVAKLSMLSRWEEQSHAPLSITAPLANLWDPVCGRGRIALSSERVTPPCDAIRPSRVSKEARVIVLTPPVR